MSSTLNAEIITPTSHFDLGEVEYLRLPGDEGLFGIKKNHAASLISLDVGEVKIIKNGQTEYWSTSGGILDLRNNPGGLLNQAVEVADRFLDGENLIVYTSGRTEDQNMRFTTHDQVKKVNYPLIILVNVHIFMMIMFIRKIR